MDFKINTRTFADEKPLPFPVRPGYSPEESFKAYNRIQGADGGRLGSKLSTIEQLKEAYSSVLVVVHSHPENEAKDDDNKDNIQDMEAVDWMEILISCHHMHGYKLDGSPLAVTHMPEGFYL